MALPPHAADWMNRAEIDYIGPFVKAWAAFNAWYRHASGSRKDRDGLRFVKTQPNPVRSGIMPLLRPMQRDGHGNIIPDGEPAQKLKLLIRDLHVCLDGFHIEVTRDEDVVERISFRSVCISNGAALPQSSDSYGLRYRVEKANGGWQCTVKSIANPANVRATIPTAGFDVDALQAHEQFAALSVAQRATLLEVFNRCNPRPFTDLFAGGGAGIVASDITFRCSDQQLFEGLIEVIYGLRNTLLHGELQPSPQAFAAYEPAYRILLTFLGCVR